VADAKVAVAAGADAIGLVFYRSSPRWIDPERALDIARAVGPFVTVVGLFVDADVHFVHEVLDQVPLHVMQFHGDEDEGYCAAFKRPYMKALRMRAELDVSAQIAAFPSASAILLDAYRPGVPGGTGETFDWRRVPSDSSKPVVLAGGLTPGNIAQALASARVYGVDVSGGVESSAGIKDASKIQAFINNARNGA